MISKNRFSDIILFCDITKYFLISHNNDSIVKRHPIHQSIFTCAVLAKAGLVRNELSCVEICNKQDHAKFRLLMLSNRRMWNNVMRSCWNIALPWKHYTIKVTSTCAFVAITVGECILWNATTEIEALEFYCINKRKINLIFWKVHPKYNPPTN